MQYEEAIDWIHSREKFKVKPGLKRMEWMMERLDHPEKKFKAVHIAGTNGKGSTLSFLRHILQQQGMSVGTFTSPYIEKFNERISVDGQAIQDEVLAELALRVKPLSEELKQTSLGEPTEFEIITAMAMLYFSEASLDFVVIETGLGGRFDSTNILTPVLSVITNIGHDHMNVLGSTIEEIAGEKAGIIKPSIPVVTAVKQREAQNVITNKARSCHSKVFRLGDDFDVVHQDSSKEGERFVFSNESFHPEAYVSQMKGPHQVENAALAIQSAEVLRFLGVQIDRSLYEKGIASTRWPARFEKVKDKPLTIIDGAHNEEGTSALVETVKRHYSGKKIVLVYSALEDKPVKKMLRQLESVVDKAYMTTFEFPRALKGHELAEYSPIKETIAIEDYRHAIRNASIDVGEEGVLLITGSLYFISQVRKYFECNENL
ncbi:folylpolyglutamate synthase/dihydrofolate synthase family protein [Halobacillus sp. Nhm2S1]|uniref:bifunctional folylpolyglutamate synthase/dihydrofolate synthase n=1 Tax=Halobacillus sp. Nhm2S1 TaxID=2866716 RepID=UPI001C736B75|nr:folylpolyglutamate synthase/dihydrofolate synthase family protein [Halobacillus sp. Nhm2S1]MBX0358884.1 bifunctional folylpolyglutamate synthase/dihydrofolate synthase [Halobacillus sp. Nhm2S1]